MEQKSIFEKESLLSHVGGDELFFKQILSESVRLLPQYVSDLNQAFDSGNSDTIRRTAHRLKGALVTLHANGAAESAKTIEQSAADGNIENAITAKTELLARIEELLVELKKYTS